jgi:hypothetical protein
MALREPDASEENFKIVAWRAKEEFTAARAEAAETNKQ